MYVVTVGLLPVLFQVMYLCRNCGTPTCAATGVWRNCEALTCAACDVCINSGASTCAAVSDFPRIGELLPALLQVMCDVFRIYGAPTCAAKSDECGNCGAPICAAARDDVRTLDFLPVLLQAMLGTEGLLSVLLQVMRRNYRASVCVATSNVYRNCEAPTYAASSDWEKLWSSNLCRSKRCM
jgi:hypothetical protein